MKGLEGGRSSFQSAIQNGRRQVVQASLDQLKYWIVLCAVLSVVGLPAHWWPTTQAGEDGRQHRLDVGTVRCLTRVCCYLPVRFLARLAGRRVVGALSAPEQ